jgi:hypothetical protein
MCAFCDTKVDMRACEQVGLGPTLPSCQRFEGSCVVVRALIVLLLMALPASAQQTVGKLTVAGDDGFAVSDDGRSRLHLGVTAGTGFDTNPYTTPLADPSGEFGGDVVIRIRPYLELNAPGSTIAFDGKAQLDYGILPGVVNPQTQQFLLYQSLLSGELELNRGGTFTFAVGDNVSFNTDPGIAVLGTLLSRVRNTLKAGVGFRPGGGTLNMRLGYNFNFTKYVDTVGNAGLVSKGALDSMQHNLQLRTDYRFLPKTGAFLTLGAGWQSYPFTVGQGQAFPLNAQLGIQGNLLPRLAFMAAAGYSNPLVLDATGAIRTGSIFGMTGQAEVQWKPLQQTSVAGGYRRTFEPIALYQYIGENRFYGRVNQLLGQLEVSALAGYSLLQFGDEVATQALTTAATGRLDHHFDASVALDFHVIKWLSFGLRNNLDLRLTNAADIATSTNLGFVRNETLVVATARY